MLIPVGYTHCMAESVGWSTLRGPAKYALIANAPVFIARLLPPTRAAVVSSLWTEFKSIYDLANERRTLTATEIADVEVRLRTRKTEFNPFSASSVQRRAAGWVQRYFSVPGDMRVAGAQEGLYANATMTPYLHALAAHLGDHLRYAASVGVPLTNLSTEPVEKKNHDHVKFYFSHTTMGGGKNHTAAILTLMQKENRALYILPHTNSETQPTSPFFFFHQDTMNKAFIPDVLR